MKSILVPARSLDRFDRNHMYRFRADDHSYFRALKKVQEGYVRKGVLQIEGWQSYVDSIPELRAMQKDCAAPPDVSFYDRFSRNVPNMTPRGDLSGVTGLREGFEVNDGMVRMRGEFKTSLAAGLYPGVDKAAAAATDRWMKNSKNYYPPRASASGTRTSASTTTWRPTSTARGTPSSTARRTAAGRSSRTAGAGTSSTPPRMRSPG